MKNQLYILLLLFLTGCIDAFEPQDNGQMSGLLVVDGMITPDTTFIELGRSIRFDEDWWDAGQVEAQLTVECDDGTHYTNTHYTGDGRYAIETPLLSPTQQYRLHIQTDGKDYHSAWVSPLQSPPLDSVTWEKPEPGQVYITLSTHAEGETAAYYRWDYQEIWELTAELYANYGTIGKETGFFDTQTPFNTYFCWGYARPTRMLLGSTIKLNANRLVNHRLISFPAGDDRLSALYYLSLTQYRIHAEAYRYYENLQKNIEQTGDIFGPIPTEIRGNIVCSSQPDEVVIGYIEACIPVKEEQFMESLRDAYEAPLTFCAMMTSLDEGGLLVYYKPYPPDPNPIIYAPASCVDCRQRGVKQKPPFWPNDHL